MPAVRPFFPREPSNEVVVYVERLDAATEEAIWYAREISGGDFHAIHVPVADERSRHPAPLLPPV